MTFRGIVGEIEDEYEKVELDWKIKNFFSLVQMVDNRYHSPAFDCYGESFYLQIYPNGDSRNGSEGWVSLYLVSRERCPVLDAELQFAIRTADGDLRNSMPLSGTFGRRGKGWGLSHFIDRTVLMEQRDEWAPLGDLTIAVTVETGDVPEEISTNDVYVQTESEYFKNLSIKEEGQQVKSVTYDKKVQAYLENNICKITSDSRPEKVGSDKVLQDLSKVWQSGDNSDVIVRVKGEEFQAHKVILGARSPVLFAMFQHDTSENRSGEIKIEDCEPAIFQQFLHYLYTGAPQELSPQNASPLYAVAEKYLTEDLKDHCLKYIWSNLGVDNFCETVILALKYGEMELLQHATDFASENIRHIVKSVEWQRFIQDEPNTANEILVKALGS